MPYTEVFATFVGTYEDGGSTVTETYYFYANGQFRSEASISGYTQSESVCRGTYTGNPNADGELSLTVTALYDVESESWSEESGPTITVTVTGETASIDGIDGTTYTRK